MPLVEKLQAHYHLFENFQILELDSMQAFFTLSDAMPIVFEHLYQMPLSSFVERRSEIPETEMEIMEKVLDHIGDRYFLIFTYHSDNHAILVHLQDEGVMNFGMDINDIAKDHVYVCMMQRHPHPSMPAS